MFLKISLGNPPRLSFLFLKACTSFNKCCTIVTVVLTRSFQRKGTVMELVRVVSLETTVCPDQGPLKSSLKWGDLAGVLIRLGVSGRSIAQAEKSHDTLRALAQVVKRHTNVPLRPEMFRESHAPHTNQRPLPEPNHIDLKVISEQFERQLRYAGCTTEHFELVLKSKLALNELVTKTMLATFRKTPSPYLVLDKWLPEQPLYTVPCVSEAEGRAVINRFVCSRRMQPELERLYAEGPVEWAEPQCRNWRHTMTMVLSRVLTNDDSEDAVTPSEQSLVRMFMHRYNRFNQVRTPAPYGIAPLLDVNRLERFAGEHKLLWMRVFHKPLFDARRVGSIVMIRFDRNSKLRFVEAVDAYENLSLIHI
jgi:hypothetical protein